jgi:antitoxin component YwqK of YwqJK toxin-antitoxin module
MPKLSDLSRRILLVYLVICSSAGSLIGQTQTEKKSKSQGQTVDGNKEGVWTFFYPDGQKMAEEHYSAGELEGWATAYYPGGKLMSKEFWKKDLQEDSAWYFHSNGRLHRKGLYRSGAYTGNWQTFDSLGRLVQSGFYQDGLPGGLFRNWFPNGNLQEVGTYASGKKEGQFIFYDAQKSGQIRLLANYHNDLPDGIWVYLTKSGKLDRLEDKRAP